VHVALEEQCEELHRRNEPVGPVEVAHRIGRDLRGAVRRAEAHVRRLRDDLVDHHDLHRSARPASASAEDQVREVDVRDAERRREQARVVRVDGVRGEAVDVAPVETGFREREIESFADLVDLAALVELAAAAVRGRSRTDDAGLVPHAANPKSRAAVPPVICARSSSGTPTSCSSSEAREFGHVPSGCG
jgi:hypothetical protein